VTVKKILFTGSSAKGALEHSYKNAADQLGISSQLFDPWIGEKKYIKGGIIGRKLQLFLPIDAWLRKMNRDFVLAVRDLRPDLILLFTNARITVGALATVKAMFPDIRVAWVWPDPLLSLERDNILNAPLIDLTATYSCATIPVLTQLGLRNVQWIPLASDPVMHTYTENAGDDFGTDISFVGSWRPERERVMKAICEHFPNLRIEIHGNNWDRDCKNSAVRERVLSKGLFERAMAEKFSTTRININVMDDTNYPAANMRFFEIPVAGGLELTNHAPEMERVFKDREHLLYYENEKDVAEKVTWVLNNSEACSRIRRTGHELVKSGHTYKQRLESILDYL
jgi:Glycosyl transferases group 1/DUF based on E. rectale Gene description (DUF3880)